MHFDDIQLNSLAFTQVCTSTLDNIGSDCGEEEALEYYKAEINCYKAHAEVYKAEALHYKTQNDTLQAQLDEVKTHALLAARHIQSLQAKLNSKMDK